MVGLVEGVWVDGVVVDDGVVGVDFFQRFSRVSSRPRNGRGMRRNSSPRLVLDLKKQGSKVLSLKRLRKRPKF